MDRMKSLAQLVIMGGFVFVWPGPALLSLIPAPTPQIVPTVTIMPVDPASGAGWFQAMRPYCNSVEVDVRMRNNPAPESFDGMSSAAACYALAGQIDDARATILQLPSDRRWQAAGVVFNAGHPVADAGDDVAAGPIMELVVEFWPNHYMALYHAGASQFELGDHAAAGDYLERFLEHYDYDDGWTKSARNMLRVIEVGGR